MGFEVRVDSGLRGVVVAGPKGVVNISPRNFAVVEEVIRAARKLLVFPFDDPRSALGSIFTIEGEEYLFARKNVKEFGFFSLKDGNRWTDAALITAEDIRRAISDVKVALVGKLRLPLRCETLLKAE